MKHHRWNSAPRDTRGYSLVELMIVVLLLGMIVVALMNLLHFATSSKTVAAHGIEASEAGRVAIDMLARDLRSAGYGADRDWAASPQPPIAYVDSMELLINENLLPYPDTAGTGPGVPQAYDPAGSSIPAPLAGTEWASPIKYRTGAEIVRWTLDLNNDGVVSAADQADVNAVDASRSLNPDDFELVRQVYGDSTNNTAGNNGPLTERIALVRRPGAGVPPMFTVYLRGSSTPWDWANGPVPAAQLGDIERIGVQITAPSGKRDWRGRYAESSFKTEVNSLRNVPQTSADSYVVDGYVFLDSISVNHERDAGERGLAGATVQLGVLSSVTAASGYFSFRVPAGTYLLKQVIAPAGYANTSVPESLAVTVPPATTRSFPDVALSGGYVSVLVFEDTDNDGVKDATEAGKQGVRVTMEPAGDVAYTGALGYVSPPMFSPVGTATLRVTAPDSFVTTTTNPVVLAVSAGDNLAASFGVYRAKAGTISGTIFRDTDRDGMLDLGEPGIQNVWVGVTTDGGVTVPGYSWSDANGAFAITVPANDPPGTTPYSLMIIPPSGYFPTSPTAVNGILLQAEQTLSGQNFGLSSFTVITLEANRVLSLASADMIEKDWNGNHTENRHGDADIVLGSDTGGSDQVSTWFNQYASATLFSATPDYTRSAPGAVMAMALDYLNTESPLERPDLVTGCKAASVGNFFVWFCQSSSGNLGYYPSTYNQAYKTGDQGDVQAVVAVDCAGGAAPDQPDIVVGTKSPTAYAGSLEVWANSNAATPTFSRTETYPGIGGMPAGGLGEVNAVVAADLNDDDLKDLVVGTRCASGGQVWFLRNMGKSATPHFTVGNLVTLANETVTALAVVDVNGDGLPDVVAGTQTASDGGCLAVLRNGSGSFDFYLARLVDAPGIITALGAADLGGSSRADLAVGYHAGSTGYVGGVSLYYLDAGTLPPNGVDPSGGVLSSWVPAVTTNDFNYGTNPVAIAPFLQDFAVGVKVSASTGAVVVFIR